MKKLLFISILFSFVNRMTAQNIKMCLSLDPNPNSAAGIPALFWPAGSTLRIKFVGTNSELQKRKVKEYAVKWSQYANIHFVFVTTGFAEIRVSFNNDNTSWSKIGISSDQVFQNQATMNFGWFNNQTTEEDFRSTILHEFGHALGLIHEHQNPNAKIKWDKNAVYSYYLRTQGWSRNVVDINIFSKYDLSFSNSTIYDKASIMHYPIDPDLTEDKVGVSWNTNLSPHDISFISSQKAYPLTVQFPASVFNFQDGEIKLSQLSSGIQIPMQHAIRQNLSQENQSTLSEKIDAKNACFYYTEVINEPIYLLDPPNEQYKKFVTEIAEKIGLKPGYIIKVGNVPNACAIFNPVDKKRYIVISQNFYESLDNKFGQSAAWLAKSIIAHELAHHLNGDTFDENSDRQTNELNADQFSGMIMYKLKAPDLKTAQLAINTISPNSNSIIKYPPLSIRLEAIAIGWRKEAGEIPTEAGLAAKAKEQPSHNAISNVSITYKAGPEVWAKRNTNIQISGPKEVTDKILGVIYELEPNQGFKRLTMSSYDKSSMFRISLGLYRNITIKAQIIFNDQAPHTIEKNIVIQ